MLSGEIEIDETYLFREKKAFDADKSHHFQVIWLFGLKDRKTRNLLIFPVESRDKNTLISIILK